MRGFRGNSMHRAYYHQKSLGKKSQGSLGKPIDDARQNIAGLPDSGRSRPAAVVNTGLTPPSQRTMSLLSERAFTVHAQASPPDAKRSHRSARLGWVTFWVTQKSHRAKTLIAERFTVGVRVLSRAFLSYSYSTFL